MINYTRITRLKDQHLVEIKKLNDELVNLKALHQKVSQVLEGTLHEVRRFSGEISSHAEQLNKILTNGAPLQIQTSEIANTIFFTSGMLSARLAFADLELNPSGVAIQVRTTSIIYKKFEKARHILAMKARAKNINIKFQGNSFFSQDVLQAFELIPFVIFENAIKYSPQNGEVLVTFENDSNRTLTVKINSTGPQVGTGELMTLIQRGARGENALRSKTPGDGLGLYLVNFLCELHEVKLKINSDTTSNYSLGNIPYSVFLITLDFKLP